MAEIGSELREARSRARIEIAQMEAQTKIRAKYLRALENEEWELLPGPTYVKSFLRTYGDMLGLDGRALVAEYKAAHEPAEDLGPVAPRPTAGRMAPQQRPGPGRWLALALVLVLAAAGGAYALLQEDDAPPAPATTPVTAAPGDEADPEAGGEAGAEPARSGEPVTVTVTARASVFVCARAGERQLERGRTLAAGQRSKRLRGREVLLTLASDDADVRVDGKRVDLPQASGPLTVQITEAGVQRAGSETTACRS